MATIVLSAVGSAIGGPIGGSIGALVGQQVDRALFFSPGSNEGPRLKELAVTTSSYGQPLQRQFGRMRVAGTIIWATDLTESSSTSGGKGKPKTTTYSYSASFAVALSSTPIARLGRIWADGNLLRGANEDLKVQGTMRVYHGHGDALIDPLIAADQADQTPAFRDCAYAVFEDLELADFGNRIPALTFEIFAQDDDQVSVHQIVPGSLNTGSDLVLANIRGFADEGGPIGATLGAIDRVFPLACLTTDGGLQITSAVAIPAEVRTLPEQLSPLSNEDASEKHSKRGEGLGREPLALRYYDEERDYQPSVQRAIGSRPSGREVMIDLPATMNASGAKELANDNAHRARWHHERITWRIGDLDPGLKVGGVVALPDRHGLWRVLSWEWYDRGIEIGLERLAPGRSSVTGSYSGNTPAPIDALSTPTYIELFEVPPDVSSNPSSSVIYAAATSQGSAWKGAALFSEQGDTLVPVGSTGSRRAIVGELTQPLAQSAGLVFEPQSSLELLLVPEDLSFSDTDIAGIASGANRLLVGGEVLQFQNAVQTEANAWRLSGLLRGRAGTEEAAMSGHGAGTPVIALDDRLTPLDTPEVRSDIATRVAAIGIGDDDPVFASLLNAGLSRRPPSPVHPRLHTHPDGSLELCWTRRARGYWRWESLGEVPLVEESESYSVGFGPVETPFATFTSTGASLTLTMAEQMALVSAHGPAQLWVRQNGTYSSSPSLLLGNLS